MTQMLRRREELERHPDPRFVFVLLKSLCINKCATAEKLAWGVVNSLIGDT